MTCRRMLAVFAGLCFAVSLAGAHMLRGTVNSTEGWTVLGSYCLPAKDGSVYFNIRYPKTYAPETLVLFYDDQATLIKSAPTCKAKYNILKAENDQFVKLTPDFLFSRCQTVKHNGEAWYSCYGHRSLVTSQDRMWYIGVSHCQDKVRRLKESPSGIKLDYLIKFLNSHPGSCNQTSIPLVDMIG
ncbi:transmembrane protein 145-like isoform X1 [Haliotis rufescens]|uniref:transmembrane protein 145-like isoform X1 n=1 Tax=Haliotis rufescens TaxID=6454 RepID=UPI001EB06C46|nr:transmembrane protein 145-like isoform X1 [Haliotis rufescens]